MYVALHCSYHKIENRKWDYVIGTICGKVGRTKLYKNTKKEIFVDFPSFHGSIRSSLLSSKVEFTIFQYHSRNLTQEIPLPALIIQKSLRKMSKKLPINLPTSFYYTVYWPTFQPSFPSILSYYYLGSFCEHKKKNPRISISIFQTI